MELGDIIGFFRNKPKTNTEVSQLPHSEEEIKTGVMNPQEAVDPGIPPKGKSDLTTYLNGDAYRPENPQQTVNNPLPVTETTS